MKISAIICEYNPFHAGHLYHIERTKAHCDHVIAIMSGSFVQRGLPAIYDKWTRTDAALAGGADLVLELPTHYALSSAERFAYGGVLTAQQTGIVDTLSFGCETENLAALNALADLFADEPAAYRTALKEALDRGISYPAARAQAAECFIPAASAILSQSNAILAVEYLKALKRLKSTIRPVPVLRVGSACEQSDVLGQDFASARAIRHAIAHGIAIPENVLPPCSKQAHPIFLEDFSAMLLYRLRMMTPAEIGEIAEVGEGLEYKIYSAARRAEDYPALFGQIKTKRYPQSRIQRIFANCLLGITKEMQHDIPPYLRVLGVRKEKRFLLSLLSAHAQVPVITSPAGIENRGLALDLRATDIRALCDTDRTAGRDFTEKLHIL